MLYFAIGFISCWFVIATVFLTIEEINNGEVHLNSESKFMYVLVAPALPFALLIFFFIKIHNILHINHMIIRRGNR